MASRDSPSRRRFVQLAGATAAMTLLAGCEGPETDDIDDDPELEEGTGNGQDADDDIDSDDSQEEDGTDDETAEENDTDDENGGDDERETDDESGSDGGGY